MSSQDVRFGLIGHGLWGTHHANAIAKTEGAQLVAIAERSAEGRASAKQSHPDVLVFEDYQQLLASGEIDMVDVVVPSHLHFDIAAAALQSGKHVFLEKPMTLSVEHCQQLLDLAQERQKVLAVDHEMRLSSIWGKVKQMIGEGTIGRPQYVLLELSRFPYRLGAEGWRFDIKRVGNWILEEPIHFFDLARWYLADFGEPVSVYARASSRQPEHPELQDNFATILSFAGGGFAVISQTLAAFEHHVTCKVAGTRGAITAKWSAPDARHPEPVFELRYSVDDPSEVREVSFAGVTGEIVELEQQVAALVACVRDGAKSIATGDDGRWAVLLCLAAQRSVELGRPVTIDEMV